MTRLTKTKCDSAADANAVIAQFDAAIQSLELPLSVQHTDTKALLEIDGIRRKMYAHLTRGQWLDEYKPRKDCPVS